MTRIVQDANAFNEVTNHVSPSRVVVLMDERTHQNCYEYFKNSYLDGLEHERITIPVGEDNKTLQRAEMIWNKLLERSADRATLLIGLGGGMITDLTGFVASTFKRGIPFILVPTTNLAMCDAAIGGKTGVNLHGYKNQIGTFSESSAVLIDPQFLRTLGNRELKSGFAETIKHALIADASLWATIQGSQLETLAVDKAGILNSIQIKESFVAQDMEDNGIRQALNFGHTIGHALEATTNLLHGEAIVFGMVAELFLSQKRTSFSLESLTEVVDYLASNFTFPPIEVSNDALLEAMTHDKKNVSGDIKFSLIPNIGEVTVGESVGAPEIFEAIQFAKTKLIP